MNEHICKHLTPDQQTAIIDLVRMNMPLLGEGSIGMTVREIVRQELRSGTERLTWDGATIRQIVREEIVAEKMREAKTGLPPESFITTAPKPKPKWLDDEMLAKITDAPKPKTDLERAAEIADRFAARRTEPGGEYTDGYWCAATGIAREIRALKPSPDWRKIADELAESLRGICKLADPYGGWAGALKAYDEAVKGADQ